MDPTERTDPSRRSFLSTIFMVGGLLLSYGVAVAYGIRFLFRRAEKPRFIKVLVTYRYNLPAGDSYIFQDLSGKKMMLVNQSGTIKAFSTTCTHLGCQVFWRSEEKIFHCPCHNGIFNPDGKVVSGPPPRPLEQLEVEARGESLFVTMREA